MLQAIHGLSSSSQALLEPLSSGHVEEADQWSFCWMPAIEDFVHAHRGKGRVSMHGEKPADGSRNSEPIQQVSGVT